MPNLPQAGAELTLLSGKWNSDFNKAIADGAAIDAMFSDIAESASAIGSALDGIGDVDVTVNADIDDADLSVLENLDTEVFTPEISPDLDTAPIEDVEALNETTVEPDIDPALDDTEVQSLLDLDTAAIEPSIDPVLDDADGVLTTLDEWEGNKKKIEPEVNAKETEQGKQVTDKLNTLIGLQAVDIIMNVTGTILDVIAKLDQFTFAPILSLEDAVARITAQTGGLAVDTESLVSSMHAADLGDWEAIADVLISAQQQLGPLSGDLETAATAALTVTKAFPDKNPVDILQAMTNAVNSGLVPSFSDAADLIVGGFQLGNDKGGDFLKTLEKYSNVFSELGLDGSQTLSVIKTGLDSGFESATTVAQAFKEINENLGKAGTDWNAPANEALRQLGLTNPKAVGDEVGGAFIDSVIEAIKTNPGQGMTPQEMAEAIFGTRATGTATLTGILGLDVDKEMGDLTGRANAAATIIEDTLRGAVDDFLLELQTQAQNFLSSEQIDLPGKIAAIKEGLQEAVGVLTEGGTLGEALEVGLNIQGVDEFIQRFESAMGNFVISILQVVASLQEIMPGGSTGEGTRAEIARLSEGQLAFDLKVANPDEVAGMVQTAADRGVEDSALSSSIQAAAQELIDAGDIGKARELLDTVKNIQQEMDATNIATMTATPEIDMDLGVVEEQINIVATNLTEKFNDALAKGDIDLATAIAEQLGDEDINAQLEDAKIALEEMNQEMAEDSAAIQLASADAAGAVGEDFQTMGAAARQLDADVTQAVSGGSIVPEFLKIRDTALFNFPLVAASEMMLANASKVHFGIVSSWARVAADSLMGFGNVLPILDLLITKLGQASAAATNATANVNGIPTAPGGGGAFNAQPVDVGGAGVAGGAFSATSNNVYNNFYVQSIAQADTAGYSVARQIRGMG